MEGGEGPSTREWGWKISAEDGVRRSAVMSGDGWAGEGTEKEAFLSIGIE
jgi:hypothetical protein